MATAQSHGRFKTYLHLIPSAQFSIYFTLQKHLSCKPFNISTTSYLINSYTHTINALLVKLLISPLYLGSKISQLLSQMSYFATISFINPLSVYRAITSPLHSNISDSILYIIIYQLVGHFTCNYLTQPILDNIYLLIGTTFTCIKNMTKRTYPLTNPPAFTLPLKFTCNVFNSLMYLLRTILTTRGYFLMNFHSISRDARGITLAYLTPMPL